MIAERQGMKMKKLTLELTEKAREKIEKWGGVAHVIVRRVGGG